MKVTLHFIRHGESLANVVQHETCLGSISHLLMLDPDLSEKGKIDSSKEADKAPPVDIVMSSELLRAIHTAARTYPTKMIHVIPHVKELGYGLDNVPIDKDYQKTYIGHHQHRIQHPDRDDTCVTFIEYFQKHILPRFQQKQEVHCALFTHSRFMKKVFGLKSLLDVPNNGILTKTFYTKIKT